jgi:methionyl-tRNA synthetase
MNGFYVTTAIPYVNAAPHLGHALELVQADVLARHRRRRGPVRFLTGTDENALKNVTAARAAGVAVPEFVAARADRYAALRGPLSLSFDDFIRPSADPRHRRGVEELWRRCAPDLYRRRYEGRDCAGCEQFYAPPELLDGRCAEHGTEPEHVAEENWFFRLSRYGDVIENAITSGQVRIEPEARRDEVLAFVRSGLADISVSRPAARADRELAGGLGNQVQRLVVLAHRIGGGRLARGAPNEATAAAAALPGLVDAVGRAGAVFRRLGPVANGAAERERVNTGVTNG